MCANLCVVEYCRVGVCHEPTRTTDHRAVQGLRSSDRELVEDAACPVPGRVGVRGARKDIMRVTLKVGRLVSIIILHVVV